MNLKILVFLYFILRLIKGELNYNIDVPEFICDKRDEQGDVASDTTTIGLEGEGKLDFKVNFKRMSRTCRNTQRCNLMAWKVIREFEEFLNNYPYMKSSSIEFNNTMLVPGLEYILDVFVTQGNIREQKQLVLNFVDDDSIRAAEKPLASIKLIGVPSSEARMAYVLHAEINICSNISDYYFRWELLGESNNLLERFVDRSSELNIPPFTFRDARKYLITCNLVNIENNEPFAKSTFSVNITNEDEPLMVKLPMLYTTVQVQQLINIKPYIVDFGKSDEDIKIEWSCMLNDKNLCENNDDDELNIEGGFLNEGEYNISLKVTKGSVVRSDFCLVRVMKDVPSIEIETVESPVIPSSGMTIKANVNELRTFCTLQWQLEEELDFFKLSDVPGNVNELYNVTVTKDLFLQELEEFSTDVINKEFNLIIPPPSDKWTGLSNSGGNYQLRFLLEVTCPKAQLQNNEIEIEYSEEMLNDTITVSALVNVDVNVAPELQELQVEPTTGVALQTMFTFKTQEAVKTGADYPLLYKFGYLLGDREFIFCNMLGFKKAQSYLPYTDDGVTTFLEVCDSFKSCGKTIGPTIRTTVPDKINEKMVLRIFKEKLNTEDYYKAFGYALSVIYTAKSLNEDDNFRQHFSNEVYNKIQYLLNSYSDDVDWSRRVNKLISNISEFNDQLLFSDVVLNGLVELRSKLLAAQKEKLNLTRRQLLGKNKKVTNLENFKSYLEVSDLIITSSADRSKIESEKKHLRQKIMEYMGRLCVELIQKQQKISLELKTVILVVEKLPKKSFNNFHIIPFDGNLWNTTAEIKLNAEALNKTGEEKLCIAKTTFKDFFNKTGVSYGAMVVNGNDGNLDLNNIQSIVLMPVDEEQIINKVPKCILYNNGWQFDCKFTKLFSKYAQCSCTKLGHFYLKYEDKPIFTTTATQELLTDSSLTDQMVEVSNTVTNPVPDKAFSTKVEETTLKLSPQQPLTTPMIKLTTDVEKDAISTTNYLKETSTEVTQNNLLPGLSNNRSIKDGFIETNDIKPSDFPSASTTTEKSQSKDTNSSNVSTYTNSVSNPNTDSVTIKYSNIITQQPVTEIEEVTDTLEVTSVVETSFTSANAVSEESVPLNPNKEANPSLSVAKSPAADSDISTATENSNANTEISSYPSTISVSLSSSVTDENTTKSVDSEVPVNTVTTLTPVTPTTEKGSSENVGDKAGVNKDVGSKEPTEKIPTIIQFLTPPTPTATIVSKNITNNRQLEDSRLGGGSIQGGIQANFNTGFSFNFYLNTTHK